MRESHDGVAQAVRAGIAFRSRALSARDAIGEALSRSEIEVFAEVDDKGFVIGVAGMEEGCVRS